MKTAAETAIQIETGKKYNRYFLYHCQESKKGDDFLSGT